MRIYNYYSHGRGTVFVTPGTHHPETSDWWKVTRGPEGKEFREPVMFTIRFRDGMAEVDKNLGDYMIAHKLAQRSPIIVPQGVAA